MIRRMSTETLHRKKDPARLQAQLLESAAMIAGRDGIAALSLNAVAREAGVSKGGLLHHFPNKQALIFALFARLLAIMEEAISGLMQNDRVAYGRFTRAYLNYLSDLTDTHESRQLMVLSLAMPDEPVLRKCWRDWMLEHLAQGDELDNGPTGTLVRYAADGIWLSELTEGRTMDAEHRRSLVSSLSKMTLPA
ncbi:TetR/AcrR family transcriptional regulator [Yokenella regensburgei]|jgi:AcrR family transcriptional regulator|uniref:TetR family transcriptional regulator n=1 Tax=Yokenella regensburgei TaxID=158877 RepID=A0AB38FXS6_9ENTR|nr:TetR/AcrR family transcriptional regulator [Yokenella regensburgei]EHM44486.1 transcriptional regulator, TetR family [Yokenella regensburgei ATCC 43003]KFD23810.1 TetR family transcriptional regulator [Yokenella regensburgei ATCC 49455]MDQ4428878.1 TetR/AcrR family transcriptional regulator [Yokenella regensburgei]RKR63520.1 TetR family transcriptional regulator [Yokenella regensburgei]SQA63786.1 transcriptional regulator BetI [Yokenella regensburgei]